MKTAPLMLPARYSAMDLSTQYSISSCRLHIETSSLVRHYTGSSIPVPRGRDVVCERIPVAEIKIRCMEKEADGAVRVLPRLGDTGRGRVTVSEFAA
jgi:hypothetical protein